MFCVYCRADIPSNATFCGKCGMQQQKEAGAPTIACPYCKVDNPQDAFFCRSCGEQLNRGRSFLTPDNTLPGWPLPGPLMGEGQALARDVPMEHGTPQVGDVPMVQGTPSIPERPF